MWLLLSYFARFTSRYSEPLSLVSMGTFMRFWWTLTLHYLTLSHACAQRLCSSNLKAYTRCYKNVRRLLARVVVHIETHIFATLTTFYCRIGSPPDELPWSSGRRSLDDASLGVDCTCSRACVCCEIAHRLPSIDDRTDDARYTGHSEFMSLGKRLSLSRLFTRAWSWSLRLAAVGFISGLARWLQIGAPAMLLRPI